MNNIHQPGDILHHKYKIERVIGKGSTGITYSAVVVETEQQVAIKSLFLRNLDDWKQIELFEREAKILAALDHPAIPKYLDYFHLDRDTSRDFYIVQQLASGKSLFQLVKDGWRTTESEIKSIAEQILKILIYLHGLVPAVIHRDIKPQNLILSEQGKIFLVDFGSVQNTYYTNFKQGSTVVGTYGFMAPEQFRGQASPATDLYNLGATLVYLLTHHSPAELPHNNLKINFRDRVQISHQFATWLDKMIEPNIKNRFTSAQSALKELRSYSFTTRESFKKIFTTKLNLITVSLIAVASIIFFIILNTYQTDNNKTVELEKNPKQLCNSLDLAQYYLNNGGNPDLIISYDNAESNLLFCLLAKANNHSKNPTKLLKTLRLIIDMGANLEVRNNKNKTPLLYWLSTQRYGNNINIASLVADLLIDSGANINAKDSNNSTPLLLAMHYYPKDIELAKKLIARGAEINIRNNQGNSPLLSAVENNNLELAQFLIDKGADFNILNSSGETLLFKAVEKGDQQIIKLLIELGININHRNNSNLTAIFKVFHNHKKGGKQAILELLIAQGAEINIRDNNNRTFLSYVAGDKNISSSVVELLLSSGLEVDPIDTQGYTPLSYAVNNSNWQVVKILINHGADVNIKVSHNTITPVLKAIIENNLEITKLLLDYKADLNISDNQTMSLLVNKLNSDSINKEIFKLLIDRGLNINTQNEKGNTLLSLVVDHYSHSKDKLKIVEFLIANGADVNIRDQAGRSVLLKATYRNNREIIELLKRHGAKY